MNRKTYIVTALDVGDSADNVPQKVGQFDTREEALEYVRQDMREYCDNYTWVDEETGETTTYLEDFVYAFADGGLLGIEPVGSVENVSGTLMLAENDKVLDILLGGAAE